MDEAQDTFADIRPYRDDEVPAVISRLQQDPGLANALAAWKLGPLHRWLPGLTRWLVGRW